MWAQYEPLKYNRTYTYPNWALALGMCMGFVSMVCIPIYFAVQLLCEKGTLKQVSCILDSVFHIRLDHDVINVTIILIHVNKRVYNEILSKRL